MFAEALVLRKALIVAYNLGIQHVIVESDCVMLIKACRGEIEMRALTNILQELKILKERFVSYGFT